MRFHIDNMECGGCVRGVEKAITSVDPDAKVHADLPTRNVAIDSSLPAETFSRALQQAGFFASEV